MLLVTHATHCDRYRIDLRFNDGSSGIVDLEDTLWGDMFEPLRDLELFAQFSVCPIVGTIVWPNGADLAPEYLHDKVTAAQAT